ncbi:DNA-processing protein DprA [Mesomycoplasma molare]|uniref:DNA-processing protein DprA n=1 Tax=Mesomycoplasma molare TaxID=171288 RepID=A0ABY5TV74_9BACT|nr:DNA-processing protein DprA [Mesomycoplasma molare]UWD33916.1 DNA-processing protein DprA [Mesomycoplasma molare]
MNNVLIYFAIKYKGNFNDIYNALKNQEKISENELKKIEYKVNNNEIKAFTILDDIYPEEFKVLVKPPFVVFYEGNVSILKNKWKIYLTGDEKNNKVNQYLEQSLKEIAKRYTLITCFYKNLDIDINNFFITNNSPIIYVSTNGIKNPYFADKININENKLIISEYPNEVNISKNKLKNRNRLAAALSESLIIYSSKIDSGINNLVTNFLNLGKEIYCFPGDFSDEDGNANLIKDGANIITSIKDIYSDERRKNA